MGDKSGLTFGKDARDLLIDCSVEFITLISSEANEIAEKESKKTIAAEHIDKALRELGFPEYVSEVLAVAGEHKEQLKASIFKSYERSLLMDRRRGKRKRTNYRIAGSQMSSCSSSSRSCLGLRRKSTIRGLRDRVVKWQDRMEWNIAGCTGVYKHYELGWNRCIRYGDTLKDSM